MSKYNDDQIVSYYESGKSSREISKITSISNTQINRILKTNNVQKRSTRTKKEIETNIVDLYLNGESSESIASKFKLNGSTICRILKRNKIQIRSAEENKRKYDIDSDFFKAIDTEEKAYFLGFLYADGTIHNKRGVISLVLHKKDVDILKKFSEIIYGDDSKVIIDDYARVSVYSAKMKKDLINHGCTPQKSFKLSMPNLSDDLYPHFIRGLFDGDGCFYKSDIKNSISIIGSKSFLNELKDYLFKKIGIVGSFSKSKGSDKIYTIYYSRSIYLPRLVKFLYNDATVFLKRKRDKAFEIIKDLKDSNRIYYSTNSIVKYNTNRLTSKHIESMPLDERKQVAQFVFNYFSSKGFPFPKYTDSELKEELSKLKDYNIEGDCFKSLVGQKITHHFCEHFFSVKNDHQPSLYEAFNDDERLMSTINNRMGITYKETFSITGNMIRQGLRNSYNAFGVSFFKPIVARYIYEKYAPPEARVLDISAGFGQRMLGACCSKNVKKYVGLDPWVENFEAISEIKDYFNFDQVELYNIGSEKFKSNEMFNFCFSSPPFFNKEIYCNEDTQAYFNRDFDKFIGEWWIPTVQNVHNMLDDESLFILNMDKKMAEDMIKKTESLFTLKDTYSMKYSRKNIGKEGADNYYILKKVI